MNLILGMDAAWGGLGWCLASERGPLSAGHIDLSGREWRWPALAAFLDSTISQELGDAELLRPLGSPPVRLVVEQPPVVYSGASRSRRPGSGKTAGNQSVVCYGLGTLAGALCMWWTCQGGLGYPWLVKPDVWRGWMAIGGKGRAERKELAMESCQLRGWGGLLLPHHYDPKKEGGPRADVAEAILLSVGAARNIADAPAGPRVSRGKIPPVPIVPSTTPKPPQARKKS